MNKTRNKMIYPMTLALTALFGVIVSCAIAFFTWCLYTYYIFHPMVHIYKISKHTEGCQSCMQDIANAMKSYYHHHGVLPSAYSVDENGNPMHSWRVLILPYFENEEYREEYRDLYEQIRLDEPWNSEWNIQFQKEGESIFSCSYSGMFYMVINESGEFVPESGVLFAERNSRYMNESQHNSWMNPNNEIHIEDIIDGVNSNPAGITSLHGYYISTFRCLTDFSGKHMTGANICTFDFEIKWVPENP